MSRQVSTGLLHGSGEEETPRKSTETPLSNGTALSVNKENNNNGRSNQNNDESLNGLYKLLKEAANDDDAMGRLDAKWNELKSMGNIPCPKEENKTSLHLAAERGFVNVIKKLLEEGAADASVGDEDGWKPLHFACSVGHEGVIAELLRQKANPKATDRFGRNLLHIACTYGQTAAFELIVKECRELLEQRTSSGGMTPLHSAIWWSNETMITTCLSNESAINVKDEDGWTPLMMAAYKEDKGKMDTLIKRIKEVESEPSLRLNDSDNEGKTPLMVACEEGWSQGVTDLVQAGASFNLQDCLGRTALHYAVKSGKLLIIETIIENTDPKLLLITDYNGVSAFEDFDFNQAKDQQLQDQQSKDQQSKLDNIADRFVEGLSFQHPQREVLEWAAKGTKRSRIFRMLVESLTSKDIFQGIDAKDLSVFELAVHSRLQWVLWLLIDNFPATSEALGSVEKAQELAKNLLKPESKSKKPAKTDGGAKQDKSKPHREDPVLFDMQNYLSDFIMAETYRRSLFKPVKPREGLDDVLSSFKATITQFFERRSESSQGRTKWIKQWRPVQDVIYGKGPGRIAEDTMNRWFNYSEPKPNSPDGAKDDNKITTQLKWIHLPVTNIVWMEDLMKRILKEEELSSREAQSFASFLRNSWVQVPDRTSASRSMRPLYVAKPRDNNGAQEKLANSKNIERQIDSKSAAIFAAYMPYLSFSKYTIDLASTRSTSKKDPYKKLLLAYKDDALHQSATLDESYYHFGSDQASRDDRDARNKAQVVTKYLKREEGESNKAFTLIRVKQLWVWTILDEWVITATPHAIDEVQEDDLPKDFLNHPAIQEQITEASSQPDFAASIATLIVNYCVDAYERKRSSKMRDTTQHSQSLSSNSHGVSEERSTRSIRQIFSDTVNNIARQEKKLFEESHKLTRLRKKDKADSLENVLDTASQLACDIKDLRDELNMLRSIVNFQLTVQKEMAGNPESSGGITGLYFSKDLEELENVAKRTQESVDTILSLAETEIANDQARQATRQGRTMMVFTVVTILFLPLSFLSSFFALSDVPFAQTPSWIHIVIFLASFAFFVPVASIALFSDAVARQWGKYWGLRGERLSDYWPEGLERRKEPKNKPVLSYV